MFTKTRVIVLSVQAFLITFFWFQGDGDPGRSFESNIV